MMKKTMDFSLEEMYVERFLEELNLELEYKRLDDKNDALITEAAKCLAETFAGVTVKGEIISEPMVQAVNLSVKNFNEFVLDYIKSVVSHGLCYIAINKKTNKIIGVFACEDFDPEEEIPPFTGNLEPMNKICELLDDLDSRFLNAIYDKTNKRIEKSEFVHMFMIGVKSDKLKKEIAKDLIKLCEQDAIARGYKGIFLEATNAKSAVLFTKYFNYKVVNDKSGLPILTKYGETKYFNSIPPEKSLDCRILYKAIDPEYNI